MKLREDGCRAPSFKDRDCGYEGPATWCDHTYRRCSQIGNQARFNLAQPPKRRPIRIHPLDIVGTLLCVVTFMLKVDWRIAWILYTISFLMVLPHVRSRVILWLTSRLAPQGSAHSGTTDEEQANGILQEHGKGRRRG